MIILASASPRRRQLLKQLGLEFEVVPSNIEEKLNPRYKPRRQAELLSIDKANAIAEKLRSASFSNAQERRLLQGKDALIIAADTLVAIGEDILGKPKDERDARRMLKRLSGKTHSVFTGFTILDTAMRKTVTKSVETKVWFRTLTEKEIKLYISKEKPFDQAGAYKLQNLGSIITEKIEGDYFNVVGLPLCALAKELKKFGVNIL